MWDAMSEWMKCGKNVIKNPYGFTHTHTHEKHNKLLLVIVIGIELFIGEAL